MTTDTGRSPSGRATHERSQSSVSPPPVGVPNAVPWWRCLHCGCDEYEEHVFTGHMKGVPMVHCANCQILHSPPDPDSKSALRWRISELEEELRWIAEFADVRSKDDSKTFARVNRGALRTIRERASAQVRGAAA